MAQSGLNVNINIWEFSNQSISLELKLDTQSWICTAVYASPNPTIRDIFWQHLYNISSNIHLPWMLVGDWNEILLPGEQKGCIFSHNRAAAFGRVLDVCGLLNLNTTGGKFTRHCT